jgi:hypothetical protein
MISAELDREQLEESYSPAQEQFSAELKAKEESTGLTAIIVGHIEREDSEDESDPTLEELRSVPLVFVPQTVVDELEKLDNYVARITLGGKLDPEGEVNGFQMTNTASSYTYMKKLDEQLRVVSSHKKARNWPAMFGTLFATTLVFSSRDTWFIDTDIPERAAILLKGFATSWKDVLKHADAELGIDQDSRKAVVKMLDSFSRDVKDSPLELRIKFH